MLNPDVAFFAERGRGGLMTPKESIRIYIFLTQQ